MFSDIIEGFKEGIAKADAEKEARKIAEREAAEREAREAPITGGHSFSNGCYGGVNHSMYTTLGSSDLDAIFNNFAPHLTNAIYSMYSNLYNEAKEANAWKSRYEELEKRCNEQSRIIESLTKQKNNSYSR